eukprot:1876290-Rhodomonas_salina.4
MVFGFDQEWCVSGIAALRTAKRQHCRRAHTHIQNSMPDTDVGASALCHVRYHYTLAHYRASHSTCRYHHTRGQYRAPRSRRVGTYRGAEEAFEDRGAEHGKQEAEHVTPLVAAYRTSAPAVYHTARLYHAGRSVPSSVP